MSYRGDRFNKRMLSLDCADGKIDASKNRRLGDDGLGVERILDAVDFDAKRVGDVESAEIGQAQASAVGAVLRLICSDKLHLVKPLLLIFEHGANREASLRKIKKTTYFRVRNELLDFFVGL